MNSRRDLEKRLGALEDETGDDSEAEGAMLLFVQTDSAGDVTGVNGVADPRTDGRMQFFDEPRSLEEFDDTGGRVIDA